jgi:hypothetical protein
MIPLTLPKPGRFELWLEVYDKETETVIFERYDTDSMNEITQTLIAAAMETQRHPYKSLTKQT